MAYIQLLALVSMLIDHLGAVDVLAPWSRTVGRFAMPAFVLMIAANAMRTARPGDMIVRLALLLGISQPLWWLVFGLRPMLCILASLLLIAAMVVAWRYRARYGLTALLSLLGLFLAVSPWLEFGPWPLLLVPLAVRPGLPAFALALVWPVVQYVGQPHLQIAALVVLAVLVLLVRFPVDVPRLPRWATRGFYPAHLALLLFV